MKHELHVVTPESPRELRDRVFRLRHRVYEQEMQLGSSDASAGKLFDARDRYSTSLLATVNGEDAATVRYTFAQDGPLECEGISDCWCEIIGNCPDDRRQLAEVTRLMVISRHRKTALSAQIAWQVYKALRKQGIRRVFVAGKVGKLARLYRRWQAELVCQRNVPYYVGGACLGEYNLFTWDMGPHRSVPAAVFRFRVASVLAGAHCRERVNPTFLFFRPRRGRPPQSPA